MAKKQVEVKKSGPSVRFFPSNPAHKSVTFVYNGIRYEVGEYGLTAPTVEAEAEWARFPQLVNGNNRPIPLDPEKIRESLVGEREVNSQLRGELESIKAKLAAYEGVIEDGD